MTRRQHNFGRNVHWTPEVTAYPVDTAAVAAVISEASRTGTVVKAIGGGHSFSPLAATDGIQLSLDNMDRLLAFDEAAGTITVEAGIRVKDLNRLLAAHGFAVPNMGDIDHQSIAGAVATGTHGTGLGYASMSTQIVGLRFVDGKGHTHWVDETGDQRTWNAVRLSLGALGVVTEVCLKVGPPFRLHSVDKVEAWGQVAPSFCQRATDTEYFEFYWLPGAATVQTRTKNVTDAPANPQSRFSRLKEDWLYENVAFGAMCQIHRRFPSTTPALVRWLEKATSTRDYVDRSDLAFTSVRRVPFQEMEIAVPLEAVPEFMEQARRLIEALPVNPLLPVEVRCTAGDNLLLSPTQNQPSGWVAFHQYIQHPTYFADIWRIADSYGARPHWGKVNPLTAADLPGKYPMLPDFQQVRQAFDPDGTFTNQYLYDLLGPPTRQGTA